MAFSGVLGSGQLGQFVLGALDGEDEDAGLSVGDTLEFEQGVTLIRVVNVMTGNSLQFTQGARPGLIKVIAGNEFQTSTPVVDPITLQITNVVTGGLRDGVILETEITKAFGDVLSLQSGASAYVLRADAIEVEASNTLSFSDAAFENIVVDAGNDLTFTDGASGDATLPFGDNLTLTDGASVILVRPQETGNEFELTDGCTYTLIKACTEQLYSPFIGSSGTGPTPPPAALPPVIGTGFKLEYPASGSVTDTMELRNPNFGNTHEISKTRISRETRGGTLIVFADPIWPTLDTLNVTISALKFDDKEALLTFIEAHLGEYVKLTDWENRLWIGIVLPANNVFTEDSNNSFTANFQFEGERVLS